MSEQPSVHGQLYRHARDALDTEHGCQEPDCRYLETVSASEVVIVQHTSSEPINVAEASRFLTHGGWHQQESRYWQEKHLASGRQWLLHYLARTALDATGGSLVDATLVNVNTTDHPHRPAGKKLATPAYLMSAMVRRAETVDDLLGLAPYYLADTDPKHLGLRGNPAFIDKDFTHKLLGLAGSDEGAAGIIGELARVCEQNPDRAPEWTRRLSVAVASKVYHESADSQRATVVLDAMHDHGMIGQNLYASPRACRYTATMYAVRDRLESGDAEAVVESSKAAKFAQEFLKEFLDAAEQDSRRSPQRIAVIRQLIFPNKVRSSVASWDPLTKLYQQHHQSDRQPNSVDEWRILIGPALLFVLDTTITAENDEEVRTQNALCSDVVALCMMRSVQKMREGFTLADMAQRYPGLPDDRLYEMLEVLRDNGLKAGDQLYRELRERR